MNPQNVDPRERYLLTTPPRRRERRAQLAGPLDVVIDYVRGAAQAAGIARPTGKHRLEVAR